MKNIFKKKYFFFGAPPPCVPERFVSNEKCPKNVRNISEKIILFCTTFIIIFRSKNQTTQFECPKNVRKMSEKCPKNVRNIRNVRKMSEKCPKNVRKMSEIYLKR